jgi:hypothetical protein
VPRFHLDSVGAGHLVAVYAIDSTSGRQTDLLAEAVVGEGGWVDLPEPLVVRAGGRFVALPHSYGAGP